jgi:tight adherence protein C
VVLVSATVAWGLVLGVVLGFGLWSIVSLAPKFSRPSLLDRLAPHLVDVSSGARELLARRSADPVPIFGILFAPFFQSAGRLLSAVLGGSEAIARRLEQSRSQRSVDRFRVEQLVWGVVGVGVGIFADVVLAQNLAVPVTTRLVVPLLAGGCGVIARDLVLRQAAAKRLARIESELPTVLEFLTLSLAAGEGVLDSLRRVAQVSSGELSREFRIVVAEVNTGIPIATALRTRATALHLPAFSRSVDQMIGALERGTPLSEVLRAQAHDAREDSKRRLLEVAGKKEVSMLVPLVFMILPMTVLFAIYPGIFVLQSGF